MTILATSLTGISWSQSEGLPRRVSLGTKVQPVSAETQQAQGLKNTRGVEVLEVLATSNAEAIGLKAGDVLSSLAGKEIEDVSKFVALVGTLRAETPIELKFYRNGKLTTQEVRLKELARETSEDFEIEYSHVETRTGRLRTVLTYPKGGKKVPAVLLLSGLGNAFIEHPSADPTGMKSLAYGLSRKGLAVLRVEKPGCGDSEGGPARDADFDSVVQGYVAALRSLKKHSLVDANSVWLFGASMGGVQAPLVASQEPVQGIAVFGSMLPNWQEFIADSTRRQLLQTPATAEEIEAEVETQAAGWHYIIREGLSPDDLAVKHEDLMDWSDATWAEGLYFSGIHVKFFQQAGKAPIAKSLESFSGRVLSLWGEADIVTSSAGHQWLAGVVNRRKQGQAVYETLPNIDHNMRNAAQPASDGVSQVVIDRLVAWIHS